MNSISSGNTRKQSIEKMINQLKKEKEIKRDQETLTNSKKVHNNYKEYRQQHAKKGRIDDRALESFKVKRNKKAKKIVFRGFEVQMTPTEKLIKETRNKRKQIFLERLYKHQCGDFTDQGQGNLFEDKTLIVKDMEERPRRKLRRKDSKSLNQPVTMQFFNTVEDSPMQDTTSKKYFTQESQARRKRSIRSTNSQEFSPRSRPLLKRIESQKVNFASQKDIQKCIEVWARGSRGTTRSPKKKYRNLKNTYYSRTRFRKSDRKLRNLEKYELNRQNALKQMEKYKRKNVKLPKLRDSEDEIISQIKMKLLTSERSPRVHGEIRTIRLDKVESKFQSEFQKRIEQQSILDLIRRGKKLQINSDIIKKFWMKYTSNQFIHVDKQFINETDLGRYKEFDHGDYF